MSSLSLSSIKDITNLASVSIANIDLLTSKQGQQPSQALSQVQTYEYYERCVTWDMGHMGKHMESCCYSFFLLQE